MHAQSPEAVIATQPPATPKPVSGRRLAWLDALRGFAALCVVFDHGSTLLLEPVRDFLYHALDLGEYGVFVFFLVSGYIVPASLERKGNIRSFWISRAFRLYPLFALALVLAALGYYAGYGTLYGAEHHPGASLSSWLLMLPNVLDGTNVPNVVWTLSYEMVFYLVLTALFSWNQHRRSGTYAVVCATGALALGGILPLALFTNWANGVSHGALALNVTADVLILGGVGFALSGRKWLVRAGASVAALTVLTLALLNQGYPYPWSCLQILALMFTGTLIYRAEQSQVSWRRAGSIAGYVLVATLAAGLWYGYGNGAQWRWQWATSLAGAAITFGLGLLARNRRIPNALAWLGLVSYSVYLLHPLVYDAYRDIKPLHHPHSIPVQIGLFAVLVVVILAISSASYYGVEKPMQKLGRRVAKKWA